MFNSRAASNFVVVQLNFRFLTIQRSRVFAPLLAGDLVAGLLFFSETDESLFIDKSSSTVAAKSPLHFFKLASAIFLSEKPMAESVARHDSVSNGSLPRHAELGRASSD